MSGRGQCATLTSTTITTMTSMMTTMTSSTPSMMHQEQARVMADPGLSSVFVNPATGDIWQEGDIYTFPLLGRTLRKSDNLSKLLDILNVLNLLSMPNLLSHRPL